MREGIFAGEDPVEIARRWLDEATVTELRDPNAMALATVDPDGLPNVRVVLLKEIAEDAFFFYTNYESVKASEIEQAGKAAFVLHWKSLGRQLRVRGPVERTEAARSDAYFASRPLESRIGAWASRQSRSLESRAGLTDEVARLAGSLGEAPPRPPFWGGYRVTPLEVEFWAEGAHRLHDRFRWQRMKPGRPWEVLRLNP